MKLVFISDTHNLHRHYGLQPWGLLPDGDVLIHCGDVTTYGTGEEVQQFLYWVSNQPHKHKIWIAGNHDRCLDFDSQYLGRLNPNGIVYLQESGIEINGVKFWGSPYTPDHCDFAFQLHNQEEERWAKIPTDTDVLITHGPPFGILDVGHDLPHAGCDRLLNHVLDRVRPKVHAFGHIHEGYGCRLVGDTMFINASVHTWLWKQGERRDPICFELNTESLRTPLV